MRISHKRHNPFSAQAGFTLIEMAIVIIVMGFMILPLVNIYNSYEQQKKVLATQSAVNSMSAQIASFVSTNGRFPCPSDRSEAPGDADYGEEQYATVPVCTGAPQGICRTLGSRDTLIDGDGDPDPVIIGGVPIETLRPAGGDFGIDQISDGWGNQLTYAVSDRLCNPAKTSAQSDYKYGVITVVDEFGNPTAGIGMTDMTEPPDGNPDPNAMFVVLSHGASGMGAFTYQGTVVQNCGAGTVDFENCDNDGTFVSGLTNIYGDNADFNDDYVYVYLYQPNTLWDNMRDSNTNPTAHIMNLNTNNVGVLTQTPQERLHVIGNTRAATVRADRFCFEDGASCFDVDYLQTSRIAGIKKNSCNAGEVLATLGNNTATCVKPSLIAPGVEKRCPVGAFLRGIMTNGVIICTDGTQL